jgi:3'-phosphoadenosine 5'-phosphosulfate (PAPS) 3'-phosphatase
MTDANRTGFATLLTAVVEAAEKARELQPEVTRALKHDGSILTEADIELNTSLTNAVRRSFPDSNIIAEEDTEPFSAGREWTFTIDPIDGTDAYSQGMPGWCVAVGIHDRELRPAGGIIAAPIWGTDPERGLFAYHLPDGSEELIGADPGNEENRLKASSLMVGSKLHKRYDLSVYPGKIRSIGSSLLHTLAAYIHPDVAASILTPAYIWDISAAHGIITHHGIEMIYPDGSPLSYDTLVHRQRSAHCIFTVRSESRQQILEYFIRRENQS